MSRPVVQFSIHSTLQAAFWGGIWLLSWVFDYPVYNFYGGHEFVLLIFATRTIAIVLAIGCLIGRPISGLVVGLVILLCRIAIPMALWRLEVGRWPWPP